MPKQAKPGPKEAALSRKIETVLIGTSLTEASDQVVRAGLQVARAAQARVVLGDANVLIVPPAAAREQAGAARGAVEQEVLVG